MSTQASRFSSLATLLSERAVAAFRLAACPAVEPHPKSLVAACAAPAGRALGSHVLLDVLDGGRIAYLAF